MLYHVQKAKIDHRYIDIMFQRTLNGRKKRLYLSSSYLDNLTASLVFLVTTTSPTQIQSRTIEHSIILIVDAFYSVDLSVWTIKSVSLHMSIIYLKSLKIQRKSKMLRRQVRDCLVVSDMAMWISSRDRFYKQTSVKMARFISQQTRMMQGRGNKGVWQLT